MKQEQSKYWQAAPGCGLWSTVAGLLCLLLLIGCTNHADWVALENLPGDGSSQRQQSSSSGSTRTALAEPQARQQSRRDAPPAPRSQEEAPETYRVQSGDTLYSIAFRYSLDFREVASANDIPPPYTIVPGQEINLQASTAASTGSSRSGSAESRQSAREGAAEQRQITAAPIASPRADPDAVGSWAWPVDGNIVRTFSDGASGSKGIDIDAPLGESVRAAADGRVVYAGDGLRGYGNLIILEHPGRMLSAYAHTRVINVDEQQEVRQGDVIAEVGNRGNTPLLHFEIRQEGKPVDPLGFLPPR